MRYCRRIIKSWKGLLCFRFTFVWKCNRWKTDIVSVKHKQMQYNDILCQCKMYIFETIQYYYSNSNRLHNVCTLCKESDFRRILVWVWREIEYLKEMKRIVCSYYCYENRWKDWLLSFVDSYQLARKLVSKCLIRYPRPHGMNIVHWKILIVTKEAVKASKKGQYHTYKP